MKSILTVIIYISLSILIVSCNYKQDNKPSSSQANSSTRSHKDSTIEEISSITSDWIQIANKVNQAEQNYVQNPNNDNKIIYKQALQDCIDYLPHNYKEADMPKEMMEQAIGQYKKIIDELTD
ncbi:MAG: hypothetical protein ACK5MG_07815 [Bacteroidales bacterium]